MNPPKEKADLAPSPFRGRPVNYEQRGEMRTVLEEALRTVRHGHMPLKIPRIKGRMQKHPEMHYHFKPEFFLQTRGTTEFQMPKEQVLVKPGEMCIMPAGVPHKERVEGDAKGPFRNLVCGFYSKTLSLHWAFEIEPGKPEIEAIEFFDTPNLDTFTLITNQIIASYHSKAPAMEHVLNGLVTAFLGMCLNLVEAGSANLNKDIEKIFQTKWLVREQISNPKLNVKNLAEKLRCSPDYLSHLFHTQTGEKLIHYIQRIRIEGAMLALKSTQLYISEIAWSSGYQDPAYFTRVFKKFTGESPQEFRSRVEKERNKRDAMPKTIYYDREDYSHGQPVGKE
jgi:AraC-like DNA-binding protein/mannose-6-phosphate isomerase-like protein (cupin superfamily)